MPTRRQYSISYHFTSSDLVCSPSSVFFLVAGSLTTLGGRRKRKRELLSSSNRFSPSVDVILRSSSADNFKAPTLAFRGSRAYKFFDLLLAISSRAVRSASHRDSSAGEPSVAGKYRGAWSRMTWPRSRPSVFSASTGHFTKIFKSLR